MWSLSTRWTRRAFGSAKTTLSLGGGGGGRSSPCHRFMDLSTTFPKPFSSFQGHIYPPFPSKSPLTFTKYPRLYLRFNSTAIPAQRTSSHDHRQRRPKDFSVLLYAGSVIILVVGVAYASVPLYRLICNTTGLDGTPMTTPGHSFNAAAMQPVQAHAPLRIRFTSATSATLGWKFTPITKDVVLVPGQTALAFFTARNETNDDVVGISTYSVVPAKAAQYFNKIQCFCFEEQKLEPKEEVQMPVYFFVDPEFATDPWMADVKEITLHYTFFRSKQQH